VNWPKLFRRARRLADTTRYAPLQLLDAGGNPIHPCPECGGTVRFDLTCHTYAWSDDGTGGKACMSCDSAWLFICARPDPDGDLLEDGCGWSYTWGLNPRNPRAAGNASRRPPWIPEHSSPPR
jgi:hypothetical protein